MEKIQPSEKKKLPFPEKKSYFIFIYKKFMLLLNSLFSFHLKNKNVVFLFIRTKESAENTAKPTGSANPIITTTLK